MSQPKLFDRYWQIKSTTPDGETRSWTEIDFECSVLKTEHSEPNETELKIFNLTSDSRTFLSRKGTVIEVEAGYQETHGIISKGQINTALSLNTDVTWETTLKIQDGASSARNVNIQETYKAGTQYQAIFNALINKLTAQTEEKEIAPLTRGNIDLSTVTGAINKPLTFKELAIDRLSELCRSWGLRWYIIDGALYIVKSNLSISNVLIDLNAASGLIGTPEQTEKGYKVVSLLRHEFQPGMAFILTSETLKTRMIIRQLTHTANTRGEFLTELECEIFK